MHLSSRYRSLTSLALCLVAVSVLAWLPGPGRPSPAAARETPVPAAAVAPKVAVVTDLTYRTLGHTELKLDLARPARGNGPFPAVVVLNGGCWMDLGGDRKFCAPLLRQLAERGYVAVAVTHRSSAAAPFPAQLHDVKAAVRWLRAHVAQYRIDPERIAAVGFSSGGHLACLLGSTTAADNLEEPEADRTVSSRVQAVVACYAPTDLVRLRQAARAGKPSWLMAQTALSVLNKLLPEDKGADWAVKASPLTYARKQTAPTLLVHGSADPVVPCEQSERYAQTLTAAGASVRLLKLDGASHGFGSGCGDEAGQRSDAATLEFLDRHFQATVARR